MREQDPELTKRWSDRFLARFLFARKLDVNRALTMLKNHVAWREKFNIDTDFNVEKFKGFLMSGMNVWAPTSKDKHGRAVTYLRPRNMDPALLNDLQTYIHFAYYSTDALLDTDISFMREGMIVIEDFGGATLSTFSGFMGSKIDMKEMFDSIQENVPARIRHIILLDAPWYVRFLVALVKPFMKKRMREKISSIRSDELPEFVTPDNLLEEYGGTLKFDYMAWTEEMLEKRGCLSEGKYFNVGGVEAMKKEVRKVEETNRHKKKKNKKSADNKKAGDKKTKSGA